jgi:hypothetical protein
MRGFQNRVSQPETRVFAITEDVRVVRTFVLILGCAVAVSNCSASSTTAPDDPVNAQVVLAPGESATVSGASIRIRFQGVLGDSRCPADALCIQGGDAIVRLDVLSSGGIDATYDLHTGNLAPARHGSLTITLVALTPYPFSSRPISPGDYRATLRVTR